MAPDLGTELIVIPIDDPCCVTRFTVPAHHVEHVFNAHEEKGSIVFDAIWYPTAEGRDAHIRGLVHGRVDAPLEARVARGVIDTAAKTCVYETRDDRPASCRGYRLASKRSTTASAMSPDSARRTPSEAPSSTRS